MYFPKSQIIPNLYTNDNKLVYKGTSTPYQGYYHILSNSTLFSGKNPQDGQPRELSYTKKTEYSDGVGETSTVLNSTYDKIRFKTKNIQSLSSLIEPIPYIPSPSFPAFTRYLVKKANEIMYIEVSQDIYNKILNKDKQYNWPAYIPFTIYWTTAGNSKNEVATINENIVMLEERRQKLYGLSTYFKNYSEFYL
jgi:hypothetical protein